MGNDRTLSPQAHLTKTSKSGKRHNYFAPCATDHVVFQNNHATWSGMGGQVRSNDAIYLCIVAVHLYLPHTRRHDYDHQEH